MDRQPKPLTDLDVIEQRLRAALLDAIVADGLKPPTERVGLVAAMLAVVRPELARLTAELEQAQQQTAHDPIECDHQAEAGQLVEQVKQLRAALNSIESDAERAARKGYDLDPEDIRATAHHALNPAAVSGA